MPWIPSTEGSAAGGSQLARHPGADRAPDDRGRDPGNRRRRDLGSRAGAGDSPQNAANTQRHGDRHDGAGGEVGERAVARLAEDAPKAAFRLAEATAGELASLTRPILDALANADLD